MDQSNLPVHLRIIDSPLLDRDSWRMDAMWDLVWDSLLTNVTTTHDLKLVTTEQLKDSSGDNFTRMLFGNRRLFRYLHKELLC